MLKRGSAFGPPGDVEMSREVRETANLICAISLGIGFVSSAATANPLTATARRASAVLSAVASKKPSPEKESFPVAHVVTAMSTPLRSGHPVLFLLSAERDADPLATRLQFPVDQRYSKWSVVFDSPVKIETVEVQTCEGTKPFTDGVELFVDYNERRVFSDGGRKVAKFNVKGPARALTLGFLESQGLCLGRLTLKTSSNWIRPRTLVANGHSVIADGSIGLSPRTIPDGKKIKSLVAKADRKPGEWSISWDNPLIVESIRVWNGNQNPGDTFFDNDRVRDLEIRTDGTKAIKATLEDRRFSQQVDLPEVRAIRTLDFKSTSTYPGTLATEPNISEVQLSAGGETWIPVVPVSPSTESIPGESLQAAVVRERGFSDVLDRELRFNDHGQIWKFRFRSDGTFFARVFVDRARVSKAWSATGAWRLLEKPPKPEATSQNNLLVGRSFIKAFSKSGSANGGPDSAANPAQNSEHAGLALALVGTKIPTAEAVDSLPCASRCFAEMSERAPSASVEQPVSEQIELQRLNHTLFFMRNRTEQEKQTLEFTDLKVRIHSLYD